MLLRGSGLQWTSTKVDVPVVWFRLGSAPFTHSALTGGLHLHAVLGRFVHTLNLFCKDHYDMKYEVEDYWIYEFAKVSVRDTVVCDCAMQHACKFGAF